METAGLIRPLGARQRTLSLDPEEMHILAEAPAQPSSLMGDTVVIVAVATNFHGPLSHESAIAATASRWISSQNLHILALAPNALRDGKERTLIAQPPKALIAFRDARTERIEKSLIGRLVKAGIPVVVYGQAEENPRVHTVGSDHFSGARKLVHHLAARGCRRILPLWSLEVAGDSRRPWLERREAGYRKGCEENGLEPMQPLRFELPPPSVDNQARFGQRMRTAAGFLYEFIHGERRVDALMATADGPATVVAAACEHLGVDPRRDLDIVGYDNDFPTTKDARWYDFAPSATVDKNNALIGEELGSLALEAARAADDTAAEHSPIHRLVEPELVVPDRHEGPTRT